MQLAELRLLGPHSEYLAARSVHATGRSPPGEGPDHAVDGSTSSKWLDLEFATAVPPSSVLEVEVAADVPLAAYEMRTARDAAWRDPVAWSVHCWAFDSRGHQLELSDAGGPSDAPSARDATYGVRPLHRLAPPAPPPAVPRAPPSSPPPPALEGALRLTGGSITASTSEGRLEVFHSGEWGTVCDDRFALIDAHVACFQLHGHGWRAARIGAAPASSSMAAKRVWMDNLRCDGSEARLDACAFAGWGVEDCDDISHSEDVHLNCLDKSVTAPSPPSAPSPGPPDPPWPPADPPAPPLPTPPPSPPDLGVHLCEFRFVELRGLEGCAAGDTASCCAEGCCDCVQLGEVRLYGAGGRPLRVRRVANPRGRSPEGEGARNVIDATFDCDDDGGYGDRDDAGEGVGEGGGAD